MQRITGLSESIFQLNVLQREATNTLSLDLFQMDKCLVQIRSLGDANAVVRKGMGWRGGTTSFDKEVHPLPLTSFFSHNFVLKRSSSDVTRVSLATPLPCQKTFRAHLDHQNKHIVRVLEILTDVIVLIDLKLKDKGA